MTDDARAAAPPPVAPPGGVSRMERLGALDASLLYVESPNAALHVGTVMVFSARPDGPLDYERLLDLVRARIPYAPRYRQRLRSVPGGLGAPVWVTDSDLDLAYHVRRAALPRPGSDVQLAELVARVQARPLDRDRPLWEVYLVEGLEHDRFAIVTKLHQALVDGVHAVDIGQLLLDGRIGTPQAGQADWSPGREPSDLELATAALLGALRSPSRFVSTVGGGLGEMRRTARQVAGTLGEIAGTLARTATRPVSSSPLTATTGAARRYVMVGVDLDEVRAVRDAYDDPDREHVTINDVILTAVAGALRTWLEARGTPAGRSTTVRALVPVGTGADEVMACFVDLPVGEPSPAVRLHQVAFQMRRQVEGGRALSAAALADVAGFAAPTLHALGSRLSSAVTRRLFHLVVTNAPGPQHPLFVDGHQMVSTFPVVPLVSGQALTVGVSSYDGGVFLGLNADRGTMPDVDVIGAAFVEALAELA